MSLTTALSSGVSALRVTQAGLAVTSRNVANVDTPGFARGELIQTPAASGVGVQVEAVRRAGDRFLLAASLQAQAQAGSAAVRSQSLDRVQSAFGDPNSKVSVFSRIDQAFASLQGLQQAPADPAARRQALDAIDRAVGSIETLNSDLIAVRNDLDAQIGETVGRVNTLLQQLTDANFTVVQARASGVDSVTAENARATLLDDLADLVDIRVSESESGIVEVRTEAGGLLAGLRPAQLQAGQDANGRATISIVGVDGQTSAFEPQLRSGELSGLLTARNVDLLAVGEGVAELARGFANTLNAASNASTAVPAPTTLTGGATGLLGTDPPGTGVLRLARVAPGDNTVQSVLEIDLAGVADLDALVTAINSDPSAAFSASFTGGRLSISGAGGGGVVIGGTAERGGRGFSQAFGLNDILVFSNSNGGVASGNPLGLGVRADIRADVSRLPLARPALEVGAVLERGDARGANALAAAADAVLSFPANSLLGAQTGKLSDYASRLGAEIGRRAGGAESDASFAKQLRLVADERRSGVEGVSLNEELVRLTQFQLSFQAAARVVQAVDDLFDILLNSI